MKNTIGKIAGGITVVILFGVISYFGMFNTGEKSGEDANTGNEKVVLKQDGKIVDKIDYEEIHKREPLEQFKKGVDILGNPISKEDQEKWINEIETLNKRENSLMKYAIDMKKYTFTKGNFISIKGGNLTVNKKYIKTNIPKTLDRLRKELGEIQKIDFDKQPELSQKLSIDFRENNLIKFTDDFNKGTLIKKGSKAEELLSTFIFLDYVKKNKEYRELGIDAYLPKQYVDLYYNNENIKQTFKPKVEESEPGEYLIGDISLGKYNFVIDANFRIIDLLENKNGKDVDINSKIAKAVLGKNIFEIKDIFK